jgi:hypothetical protein
MGLMSADLTDPKHWRERAAGRTNEFRADDPCRIQTDDVVRARENSASRGGLMRRRLATTAPAGHTSAMGVRTRSLDIDINAKRQVADGAARAEAKAVIERWNEQLVASRDMLWSPTIRAALIAGTPWLDVFCPGCGTSRAIDLRKGP